MNWPTSMINGKLFAEFVQVHRADADDIEPGLLPAFRLFVVFQLFVMCIGLVIARTLRPELHLVTFGVLSLIWLIAAVHVPFPVGFAGAAGTALFARLRWRWR